jgi:hypothetical protein
VFDSGEDVIAVNVAGTQVVRVIAKRNPELISYGLTVKWPSWIELRKSGNSVCRITDLTDLPRLLPLALLKTSVRANPFEWTQIFLCAFPNGTVIRGRNIPCFTHTKGISNCEFGPWTTEDALYCIEIDPYDAPTTPGDAAVWVIQVILDSFQFKCKMLMFAKELESADRKWTYTRNDLVAMF